MALKLYSDNKVADAFIEGNTLSIRGDLPETAEPVTGYIGKFEVALREVQTDSGRYFTAALPVTSGMFCEGETVRAEVEILEADGIKRVVSEEMLVFHEPLQIKNVQWTTDNADPALIKDGEYLRLSFETSHDVQVRATAGGGEMDMSAEDGRHFSGSILADGIVSDQEIIPCTLYLTDIYGNLPLKMDLETARYYEPIRLESLIQSSDNEKNARLFLKDGDHFFLSGQANHPVSLSVAAGGRSFDGVASEKNFEFNLPVEALAPVDQASPDFELTLWDAAGNRLTGVKGSQCDNQLRYYAPIQVSAAHHAENFKSWGYLKNGGVMRSELTVNHESYMMAASYSGKMAEKPETNGAVLTTVCVIGQDEHRLPEGMLVFKARLSDAAGNVKNLSEDTGWVYDRTPPSGILTPDRPGFFNKQLDFRVSFTDANLDTESLTLTVNGVQKTMQAERSADGAAGTFTLAEDGSYTCVCTAQDLAGNVAENCGLQLVIDRTCPRMTLININFKKTPVYRAGFVLARHLQIQEAYLKEIRCTLTDMWGFGQTKLWNIETPIMENGLKTAELSSVDMAGNRSEKIRFQFYIDATPPSVQVKDKRTGKILENGDGIAPKTSLEISLDKRWVDAETPDYITKISERVGGETEDITWTTPRQDTVIINAGDKGSVSFKVSAEDDVGNVSETTFRFPVEEKETAETIKALFETPSQLPQPGGTAVSLFMGIAVVILIVSGWLLWDRGRRLKKALKRRRDEDDE